MAGSPLVVLSWSQFSRSEEKVLQVLTFQESLHHHHLADWEWGLDPPEVFSDFKTIYSVQIIVGNLRPGCTSAPDNRCKSYSE